MVVDVGVIMMVVVAAVLIMHVAMIVSVVIMVVMIAVLVVHMPGLAGPETARAIRTTHPKVPIVGLTASTDRADADALLAAGANAVAHKPIDRAAFIRLLQTHVNA